LSFPSNLSIAYFGQEPSNVQQTFLSERVPTVWRIIPSFEFLIQRWDTMANHLEHQALKQALNKGVRSLKKWYDRVGGTSSLAYFICLGMSFLSVL
jgi:hypothetical protein